MTTTPIMTVSDLHKTYGKAGSKQYEALKGINFNVQPGEFVGIMGASGSGKTTLLNMLATLDQPTSGEVTIHQKPITHLKGNQLADFRAKEIGFIFQDFNLLETLSVYDNMVLPLVLARRPISEMKQKVEPIAQMLGIKDLLKKYGKKNPFTVPEGYFQDFSEKLMEQLPEKEVMPEPEIRMWDRIKPWVYMAAMFVGLMFTVRAFVGEQPSSQSTNMEIGNYTEIPDEYLDPIVNQTMMDDYELYQYLTEADNNIYN